MLVIARKLGEKVFVYGPCVITLVDIDRGKCRLGFEADKETKIFRQELLRPEDLMAYEEMLAKKGVK